MSLLSRLDSNLPLTFLHFACLFWRVRGMPRAVASRSCGYIEDKAKVRVFYSKKTPLSPHGRPPPGGSSCIGGVAIIGLGLDLGVGNRRGVKFARYFPLCFDKTSRINFSRVVSSFETRFQYSSISPKSLPAHSDGAVLCIGLRSTFTVSSTCKFKMWFLEALYILLINFKWQIFGFSFLLSSCSWKFCSMHAFNGTHFPPL